MIQQIFMQYWGIVTVVLIAALYVLTHYKASVVFAKRVAIHFIFAAEKRAEELLLATGQQKLDWVVDKGYDLMPAPVRLIVSKPLFRIIVQQVFDMAVEFAKKHQSGIPPAAAPLRPPEQMESSAPV